MFCCFFGGIKLSKIAIISEHFYPYNDNANTSCTQSVAKGLAECGEDVTVFSKSFIKNVPTFEEKDGYKIVRYFYKKQEKIDNRFGIKSNSKIADFSVTVLTSIIYKIETQKVRSFYAEKLKKEKFDYVISVSNPFMNHETANYIKKCVADISWIAYYLDPYSFNNVKNISEEKRRKNHEKNTLKNADKIIALEGIIDGYNKNNFNPFSDKKEILETTLPTLEIKKSREKEPHDKVKLLYVGRFYEDIRRPDELIKMLSGFDCRELEAEFYGSCCEYLRNHFEQLPSCVSLCGTVSNEESKRLIENSDVVLNVGNKNTNQTPSKIFEYISCCKPIINFYESDDDTSLKILKEYPSVINIKNNEKYSIKDVENFCKNAKEIDAETAERIYEKMLSKNVIKSIDEFIKKS